MIFQSRQSLCEHHAQLFTVIAAELKTFRAPTPVAFRYGHTAFMGPIILRNFQQQPVFATPGMSSLRLPQAEPSPPTTAVVPLSWQLRQRILEPGDQILIVEQTLTKAIPPY